MRKKRVLILIIGIVLCLLFVGGYVLLNRKKVAPNINQKTSEVSANKPSNNSSSISLGTCQEPCNISNSNSNNTWGGVQEFTVSISSDQLNNDVNKYRSTKGLKPLLIDNRLNLSASDKCNDMVTNDYWSHTSPEGKEYSRFIKNRTGYYYKAGENLAHGYAYGIDAVIGWQNSPTHNANMLDTEYTYVGYAFCNSENYLNEGNSTIVVQHLARL